jgi:hypothetical protein
MEKTDERGCIPRPGEPEGLESKAELEMQELVLCSE